MQINKRVLAALISTTITACSTPESRVDMNNLKYLTSRSEASKVTHILPTGRGYTFIIGGPTMRTKILSVDLESATAQEYLSKEMSGKITPNDKPTRVVSIPPALHEKILKLTNNIMGADKKFSNFPPKFGSLDVRLILINNDIARDEPSYGPPQGEVDELFKLTLLLIN